MKPPASISTTLRDLIDDIKRFPGNVAKHPFGIGWHDAKWWVYVEINSPKGTFDVETSAIDLHDALTIALHRVRREAQLAGLAA